MLNKYNILYNLPGSIKKVDKSWDRYMNPTDENDHTLDRYKYSVFNLYGDVLDIGAGDGFGAYLMKKNDSIKSITCVEIQDKAIEKMKRNVKDVRIIKDAVECLNLPERFDSIHCGHTLEHVEDLDKALEGIKRHAKDKVVISVPLNGGLSHIHLREFKNIEQVIDIIHTHFDIIEHKTFAKNDRVSSVVFITKIK